MTNSGDDVKFWAHTRDDSDERQPLRQHLEEVARIAGSAAAKFGARDYAIAAGRLHDAGKYSDAFQRRLDGSKERVDHSTAGAQILFETDPKLFLLALAILGHHGGIPDMGARTDPAGQNSGFGRIKRRLDTETLKRARTEISVMPLAAPTPFTDISAKWQHTEYMFFGRMVYSCLVDADFRDTAKYVTGEERRSVLYDAPAIAELVSKALKEKSEQSDATPLNDARTAILEACRAAAPKPHGLYSLTVPTGGGKTLASLAFAAEHARENGMSRIIYVAPYTSIIDQTAQIYSEILGTDAVLEHHHGVEYDDSDVLHRHVAENWDVPVVVTTAVQFFESLHSNKPSKCRKLHNITNSVIILDEVQTLPEGYLESCVIALAELVKHYGSTVVLCTATQPALNTLFLQASPLSEAAQEICPAYSICPNVFQRAQIQRCEELQSVETMSEKIAGHDQVLTIVNKRKTAQDLFDATADLVGTDSCYHLSTFMTPAHRARTLQEIRRRLQRGAECRVVATNLVEAGVDLDFPAVYREEAPLESIVQSAGRCNREGRRTAESSIVVVFRLGEPTLDMQRSMAVTNQTMEMFEDCSSPQAITYYYEKKRQAAGKRTCDTSGVAQLIKGEDKERLFPYETLASHFKFIEDKTKPIYVPSEESRGLIERLRAGERGRALFRALDRHQVPLYPYQAKMLDDAGLLERIDDQFYVLLLENDPSIYSEHVGLCISEPDGNAFIL